MGRMRASSEGGCRFLDPRRVLALALRRSLTLRLTRGVMGGTSDIV